MIACVNKNDKNFKALEKKYGTNLADMFTRVYSSEAKLLPKNEFYIPTEKEFLDWYKLTKQNRFELVDYIISENPRIPRDTVKQLLKGIVHTYNGENFITSGWTNTGSMVVNREQMKTIFDPNYRIMQKLQKLHPDVFEIQDTRKSYVKRVIIKSPEGAGQDLQTFRKDTKIAQKYFRSGRWQRVETVLTNIARSSHPLNQVARKLQGFSSINNIEIELFDAPYFENVTPDIKRSYGYYSPSENKIYIAERALVRNGLSETLILHEIIHALTFYAIREDNSMARDFKKLYDHAVEKLGKYDPITGTGYYPTFSLDEFVVGIFTDPAFILEMQKMDPIDGIKYTNLFEEIMDYILNLLGMNSSPTLYNQAMGVASQILDTEYYRYQVHSESFEEGDFMEQKTTGALPSQASQETLDIVKDFLNKVGVDIKVLTKITANGTQFTANGVADLAQKLISVVEGKEAQALPEEAMHFAVAIVKQTNPKLYQQLLKEINNYQMLRDVFQTYGNDPLYQKDGKPDVIKLKEEAIAKVLVEKIIQQTEGFNERPENLAKVQSWWKDIVDWFKNLLYIKSGLDQMTIDIISGKNMGDVSSITSDEKFLQKSKQDNVFERLRDISNRIDKKLNKEGEEKYFIDDQEVQFRVSDFVKTHYDSMMKNRDLLKDEYDEALDDLRKEKGTAGHADLEHAFSLFIDENGYLRDAAVRAQKKKTDNYSPQLKNQKFYETLRDNLEQRLELIDSQSGGGARFLSEVKVFNGKKTGGTMDFVAVTKAGKVKIFDWKFTALNTDFYDDIPWYKIEAWNMQMNEYKRILMQNYNVQPQDFEETRMIPIIAKYKGGTKTKDGKVVELPTLESIKIGNADPRKISDDEDYLLPVPTKDEISDSKQLDDLLKKLNAAYQRFADEKITPDKKDQKRDQLKSLFKAIRKLQIKKDVRPLIEQGELLHLKVKDLFEKYDKIYKEPEDIKIFTEEQLNEFAKELDSLEKALHTYVNVHILLEEILEGDAKDDVLNKLRDISDSAIKSLRTLEEINGEFVSKIIAPRNEISNFLSPEKVIKGFTKWFASTSTLQVKSIQLLYRKASKAFSKADFKTQDESKRLLSLRDKVMEWAKSKGLDRKELFSLIKKKDKNELIDQYNPEFYKLLNKAIKDKDIDWIKDNVDHAKLNEALEERREKEFERIKNKLRVGDETTIERAIFAETRDAKKLYNIKSSNNGWLIREIVRKFPQAKWETKEWKELNKPENQPMKEFYDYIIEKNNEYADLGYISKNKARIFLPYVKGSLIEAAVQGDTHKLSLGQRFWESISIDEGDVGYGQIDPETGRVIDTVPKYFTSAFDGPLSEDLFRTMSMYNEAALRYKYISQIEDQVRAIAKIERNKKTIMTSNLGKVRRDRLGNIMYNPEGSLGNYELFESMMKSIIYGQKYIDSDNFDAALVKIGTWGEKFNKKLGFKLFPENLEGRQITINKAVDTLNRNFSFITLGINFGSSMSNFFGGSMQSIINSGKYFTKSDFVKAELQIFANKFNGEDANKFIKALEYFLPLTDNYNRDMIKKLSVNVVSAEGVQDFIMGLMKNADRAVQTANFYAYLQNSAVIDGEVVNVREYLRSLPEFQGKYSKTSQERAEMEKRFEERAKEILNESGVMKIGKVEDGQFVIPGIDRMSDSVFKLRRRVQGLTKSALGNLSPDDVRTINMNILGSSFMVFKNWIPRLVDVRFGGLKYNSASDAYEWGRMRTVMSVLYDNLFTHFDDLVGLVVGNERGMELVRRTFRKKAEQYELETGRQLEMTEEMFMDMMISNIRSSAIDLGFLITLLGSLWGLHALAPDDDEDPLVKNQYRFIVRLADKLTDELVYFYNPTSILQLIGGGPFPAFSLIRNGVTAIKNFGIEMYGIGIGDDEIVEKNKVVKYTMRSFPLANQLVGYIPLVYPEIAKDLGMRIQSNYGIR